MTAPLWKRILKWAVWLAGGVLALPIVFYLVVLAINLRDQPPSEFANRLEDIYRNRPAVANADNGRARAARAEVLRSAPAHHRRVTTREISASC